MTAAAIRSTRPSGLPGAIEHLAACPLCGGVAIRPDREAPSRQVPGARIRYDACATCGVVFQNPRLVRAAREDGYRMRVLAPERLRPDPRARLHAAYLLRRLGVLRGGMRGGRLLDFGCGAGGFLLEARAAGLDAAGIEINRDMADHVRAHGFPVWPDVAALPPGTRFDVVVSTQVFEHLVDPRRTLAALRGHLAPWGLVLVEVPNLHHVRERLRPGATLDDPHLFYFSARSLAWMVRDVGLEVVAVEQGLRPFRLLGESSRRLPVALLHAAERLCAAVGITTALTLFARADGDRR